MTGCPLSMDAFNSSRVMVADGFDNSEIAAKMFLSDGTVRNHISAILAKLGLRNRTQIAIYYYRNCL